MNRPNLFYVGDGTDTTIYTEYRGETPPPTFGKGDVIFGSPRVADDPFLRTKDGLLKVIDPGYFTSLGVPLAVYPLYYVMYVGAQKASYFPSEHADGDPLGNDGMGDRRRRWVGFANFPSSPRTAMDVTDNDCLNRIPILGICANGGDTDYDGDFYRIAKYVYTYSIRGTATVFCHFAQAKGWFSGGYTCPLDGGPYINDVVIGRVTEDNDDFEVRGGAITADSDQTVRVDFLWSDNSGDHLNFVGIREPFYYSLRAGEQLRVKVWKDEDPWARDDFFYEVVKGSQTLVYEKVSKQHFGGAEIRLNFRQYVPAEQP